MKAETKGLAFAKPKNNKYITKSAKNLNQKIKNIYLNSIKLAF